LPKLVNAAEFGPPRFGGAELQFDRNKTDSADRRRITGPGPNPLDVLSVYFPKKKPLQDCIL
jgi:hypothetical protein